jgi:TRAP-type C4-dicarboxylate transport system permease small subunit
MLRHSPDRALKWTIAATCLAAYVLLAWISLIHVHKGLPITPWDPGLGVVFALMAFAGPRAGFVLFGGVVIAEVLVSRRWKSPMSIRKVWRASIVTAV